MGWTAEQVLPTPPRRLGRRLAHPSREERADWLRSHVAPHADEPEHTVHRLGPVDAHLAKTTWNSRWARPLSPTAVEHRLLGARRAPSCTHGGKPTQGSAPPLCRPAASA